MAENTAPPVVLVADDEPQMLELVSRHLRASDSPKFEVLEASDGDEAWRLAKERLPDLVLLDVMMPGMSGWEVCRKIRQDAALAHTGVLMLTGIGENLNETTSPLFGADEYIDKPFDFEALDSKIAGVLTKRAAQREAVPRPGASGNGVGGPAKAASSSRARRVKAKKKAKPAAVKTYPKQKHPKSEKGKRTMAAKKKAKKAKKGAKKGKKK